LICAGTACSSPRSKNLEPELRRQLEKTGLADKVKVIESVYFGLCGKCPMLLVYPEETSTNV